MCEDLTRVGTSDYIEQLECRRAGGGGLIRQWNGGRFRCFDRYFGITNTLVAEIMALVDGLHMARELGIWALIVGLDAE